MKLKTVAAISIHDPVLDGLRGLAILLVIFGHCVSKYSKWSEFPIPATGMNGVILFFALSAFTLAQSTSQRVQKGERLMPNFYIRRAFRILPLWWVFLTFSLVLRIFISNFKYYPTTEQAVLNYLMLFGLFPGANFTIIGWSLFVEECFYLFFPFIFPFLKKGKSLLLFLLTLIVVHHAWLYFSDLYEIPTAEEFIERFPLNHFYVFAMGLLAFKLKDRFNISEYGLLLCGIVSMGLLLFTYDEWRALGAMGLILTAIKSRGLVRDIFSLPILQKFGVACYSIYLFHILLIKALPTEPYLNSGTASALISFVILSIVSLIVGMITFTWIEIPSVNIAKKLLGEIRN